MYPKIVALGEPLVEIMRSAIDQPLSQPGEFMGPFPSGAPAIFADACARLGASTGFIGVVGDDAFGQVIVRRLSSDGVDVTNVRTSGDYATGMAFVAYRSDGSRSFLFHLEHSAAAQLQVKDVPREYFQNSHFVHITGSALATSASVREACYRAVEYTKAAGGKVSFDPNLRPELGGIEQLRAMCEPVLRVCDVVFPSEQEAVHLTGESDEMRACRALLGRGIPIVALKQGAHGSTIVTQDDVISAPPLPLNEVDPTGAGDCYAAAFVTALVEGWELAQVARFANIVGALSVTRRGPMEGAPDRASALAYL